MEVFTLNGASPSYSVGKLDFEGDLNPKNAKDPGRLGVAFIQQNDMKHHVRVGNVRDAALMIICKALGGKAANDAKLMTDVLAAKAARHKSTLMEAVTELRAVIPQFNMTQAARAASIRAPAPWLPRPTP